MSTTFGVLIKGELQEVAFRSGGIGFTNMVHRGLADDVKVFPIDNTAQGIHTIGDIRKEIFEQNAKRTLIKEELKIKKEIGI